MLLVILQFIWEVPGIFCFVLNALALPQFKQFPGSTEHHFPISDHSLRSECHCKLPCFSCFIIIHFLVRNELSP